jgi:hypothetical protein
MTLLTILERLGFEERKSGGSHHIFSVEGVEGIVNLQTTKDGKAKSYQVKQVRDFIVSNKLINDND